MLSTNTPRRQHGTSLIEVLVTLVIVAFGLLGVAGLQYRVQMSQMETYQREQALILLDDMSARISTNRAAADAYVTSAANPLGVGMSCPTAVTTRQEMDAAQWCRALRGAAEVSGATQVGAMIGARGCVESLGSKEYLISVVWQGMAAVSAPSSGVACGKGLYDSANEASCTDDRCRRAVSTVVRIGDLS